MKKRYILALLAASLYGCQNDLKVPETVSQSAQNPADIDAMIWKKLKETGEFRWDMASEQTVWSALQNSDQVMSVGYKPASADADLRAVIHTINVQEGDWKTAREALIDLIFSEERKTNPALKREDLLVFTEQTLPVVNVRVKNLTTVQALRRSPLVRYAEPMGYEPALSDKKARVASSSGCGSNIADIPLAEGADYTTVSPGSKSSWNHPFHGIRDGWTRTSGAGMKLMIIDTGLSYDQDNLSGNFNQGASTGRTVERLVTMPKAWWWSPDETPRDGCGHGTAMAGVAVGPRGTDGAAIGVAYNASLVSVRAVADVLIDESREVKGVSDAYILAGNRSDIRITSSSLGRVTSSSQIADAIRYAFNRGKLMFCAGGTSFGWSAGWWGVTFPASMSEVQAVTGVQDNLNSACDACHKGSQIDFVVVMEKAGNDRHPITLAMSGDAPSTVGGSSVATATTAGMATLVWGQNPGLTREQVVSKLAAASNYFPNRHPDFGWGRINVNAATQLQ
ncbi:S8 family peptidase [Tellurirhabdus rosea]|uniref:S8 family peptidase n=1 Tax=Tellurirhabdus rosea TaxID=2674997 RepID=UPI0022585509|nr:S8/S53 family peptidase [Tellurirhabdus rosea]